MDVLIFIGFLIVASTFTVPLLLFQQNDGFMTVIETGCTIDLLCSHLNTIISVLGGFCVGLE